MGTLITYGDARDSALDEMFAERGGMHGWPHVDVELATALPVWRIAPVSPASTLAWPVALSGGTPAAATVDISTVGWFEVPIAPDGTGVSWMEVSSELVAGNAICGVYAHPLNSALPVDGVATLPTWTFTLVRYADAGGLVELDRTSWTVPTTAPGRRTTTVNPASKSARVVVRAHVAADVTGPARFYLTQMLAKSIPVQAVVARRELTGDLPAEASLVAGGAIAAVDLITDLRDPGPHPAFAGEREVWAGAELSVRAGYDGYTDPVAGGPLQVPVHRGAVRGATFDQAASTRTITLLDKSDRMRAPVSLPMYGTFAERGNPKQRYSFPVNTCGVIVAALHASGIRVTPTPSSDVLWSSPLIGGCLSDAGWAVPSGRQAPYGWDGQFGPGRFGLAPTVRTGSTAFITGWPSTPKTGIRQVHVEFWVNTSTLADDTVIVDVPLPTAGVRTLRVRHVEDSVFLAELTNAGAAESVVIGLSGDTTPGWHHVAARIQLGSNAVLATRVDGDGILTAATGINLGISSFAIPDGQLCAVWRLGSIQQASLHGKTSTDIMAGWLGPSAMAFTPEADVDAGVLESNHLPAIDGAVAWELCKEVANAELGAVGFDEDGRFFFKNRDTLNATTTPVATWATDLVDNLAGSFTVDMVRNRVTAPVKDTWMLTAWSTGSEVPHYVHPETLTFLNGTSTEVEITTDRPILLEGQRVRVAGTLAAAQAGEASIVMMTTASGPGFVVTAGVAANLRPLGATRFVLRLTNTSGQTLYARWPENWDDWPDSGVSPNGGSLVIFGRAVTDQTTEPSTVTATTGAGDRSLELAESRWRQSPASVKALADALLVRMKRPDLQLNDITVPADLRVQLGDVVRLEDLEGRVPSLLGRLIRTSSTIGGRVPVGMAQTVSLRVL